jgi:pectate lyase
MNAMMRICGAVCTVAILFFPMTVVAYEGFGSDTSGAYECAEVTTFHVTSLEDSGPGTLRDAASSECRHIVFDVAGTIFLKDEIKVKSFTTIDGATAPESDGEYGITIRKFGADKDITLMELVLVNDVIINGIRFIGEGTDNGKDSLSLIGCDRVVVSHVSSGYADDGAIDISWGWGWGDNDSPWANRNITVSYSILHDTAKAMLIKYGPHHNISLHHNLFARNRERNPQIRHQVETLEFVNNIVYEWGVQDGWGYGLRIAKHDPDQNLSGSLTFGGDGYIDMNVVGNVFIAGKSPTPKLAIQFLNIDSGNGDLGDLYFEDNIYPPEFSAPSSTIAQPLPVSDAYKVTTQAADKLPMGLLDSVGPKYRTPEEMEIIDLVRGNFGPRPNPPILD